MPNLNDFNLYIDSKRILALSETWLSNNVDSYNITIKYYNRIKEDRNYRGGGVTFNLNGKIKYELL